MRRQVNVLTGLTMKGFDEKHATVGIQRQVNVLTGLTMKG